MTDDARDGPGRFSRRRLLKRVGAVGVVGAGAVGTKAWLAEPAGDHPWFRPDDPEVLVIAHQGGDGLWPGNTLFAFERAAAAGCDVVELDVHLTADGVPVCIHDATVDARTDAAGEVGSFTLAELRELDGAYGWRPPGGDDAPYRGEGLAIPTLSEVFEALPGMRFLVELKPALDDVEAVCEVVREHGMEESVMAGSFDSQLRAFRDRCPAVATSTYRAEAVRFLLANRLRLTATYDPAAHAIQVPPERHGIEILNERFVEGAHDRGLDVHAWTIDDPDEMERLVELGVDGLITDRPDLALEVLGRA